MRLLLDSHTVLWFVEGDSQLSERARQAIEDPANEKWMSLASVWEIAVKIRIGKLSVGTTLTEYLKTQVAGNGIRLLPISADHILHTLALPLHHRDPFDRLLVAQSVVENMTLVSGDALLSDYEIARLW